MVLESSPSLRDLVPYEAMQEAQPTSLRPIRWAVEVWYGPEHGRGVWARARAALVAVGRPIAKRLRLDFVIEFARLGFAIEGLDQLIRPRVRSAYHRDDVDAIAADPEIERAHQSLRVQAKRALATLPSGASTSTVDAIFPRDVMRDTTVLQRVGLAARVLEEITAPWKALGSAFESTPRVGSADDPCAWAYDPSVPPAVARRLMAGRRVVFAPHLVRLARGTWNLQTQRQAALDWADDAADFAGLLAALLGVTLPSLPTEARLDLAAVMAEHEAFEESRREHLAVAVGAIHSV